jgi:ASC-1-like (ASCH) protein
MRDLEGRVCTLRIKRVYFEKIKSGEKTTEYRDGRDFYVKMFEGLPIKYLKLHYQGRDTLTVEVRSIRLVKRPARFKESIFFTTPKIFAIKLGKIIN